jgi:hypothetical protein
MATAAKSYWLRHYRSEQFRASVSPSWSRRRIASLVLVRISSRSNSVHISSLMHSELRKAERIRIFVGFSHYVFAVSRKP